MSAIGTAEVAPAAAVERRLRVRPNPKVLLFAADLVTVVLVVTLAILVDQRLSAYQQGDPSYETIIGGIPVLLLAFVQQRLYSIRFLARRVDEFRRIVNAAVFGLAGVVLIGYVANAHAPRSSLAILAIVFIVLVTLEREIARRVFDAVRRRGRLVRPVVIAGANEQGRDLANLVAAEPWLGYQLLGFVDDRTPDDRSPDQPILGPLDKLADIAESAGASVMLTTDALGTDRTNRLTRQLLNRGIHIELASPLRDIATQRLTVRPFGRVSLVYIEQIRRGGWRRVAKRTFDVVGATVGLACAAPLLMVVAGAIKLSSPGSVLFCQNRVGRNGEPFRLFKLRTMVVGAEDMLADLLVYNEADGPLFKIRRDPRVTPLGRVLRAASIDELPQLWNVLRGDMSLVGPRPALPSEMRLWDPLLTQRLQVLPGVTGMWQVSGRSNTSFEDYTRLDLSYVDNWSLATDLAILARTLVVVARRRGAV